MDDRRCRLYEDEGARRDTFEQEVYIPKVNNTLYCYILQRDASDVYQSASYSPRSPRSPQSPLAPPYSPFTPTAKVLL